jgi:hypothetical protein
MKRQLEMLQSEVRTLCCELFYVWSATTYENILLEGSLVYNNEWFEIKTNSNKFGIALKLLRKTTMSMMAFSYKQFERAIMVDHTIVVNKMCSDTAEIAFAYKRSTEIIDMLECFNRRPIKTTSLDALLNEELKKLQTNLESRKQVVLLRQKNIESEGFSILLEIPDDEDTVIMSGQSSNNNSDFDSDSDSESSCFACTESSGICIVCMKRKKELASLAAQRAQDHINRYKMENRSSTTCVVRNESNKTSPVVSNLLASSNSVASDSTDSKDKNARFSALCIAGMKEPNDLLLPYSENFMEDLFDRDDSPPSATSTLIKEFKMALKRPSDDEHYLFLSDTSTISNFQTPSPAHKKQCVAGNDRAEFSCLGDSCSSREWWADSPATSTIQKFPDCDNDSCNNNTTCDITFDDDKREVNYHDEFYESGEDLFSNDSSPGADLRNSPLLSVISHDPSHIKNSKLTSVLFAQAREISALIAREDFSRAALLEKHNKIQNSKEKERQARRDEVNFRHYAVYLEVAGLSDKLF